MTKEELLERSDPDFLKRTRRERFWIKVLGGVALIAFVFAVLAIAGYFKNEGRVTKIEKSACAQDPRDPTEECENLRQALAKNESIKAHCIAHQRVEGTKGRFCPEWYVPRPGAPAVADGAELAAAGAGGGDASQQPSNNGHQQPGPRGGGDTGGGNGPRPDHGGDQNHANPAPSPAGGGQGGPAGGGGTSPANPKTVPEQATDALEAVTGTVTDAADKATDDVGETVDEACEHLPPALCTR